MTDCICSTSEASKGKRVLKPFRQLGPDCAFPQRIFRSGCGMCCEILVEAVRQPCGQGSSSGKDNDQEGAAVASRVI